MCWRVKRLHGDFSFLFSVFFAKSSIQYFFILQKIKKSPKLLAAVPKIITPNLNERFSKMESERTEAKVSLRR